MPLKAVIFDFGGVLVRTQSWELRRQWERRLGLEAGTAERIIFGGETDWAVQLGQITDENHWDWLGTRFGLAAEELAELRRDFFATDKLDTDLLAFVDRLREAGYRVGLLSNAGENARTFFASEYGIPDHFDSITISAEEGMMKPDPRIFQLALLRAGAEPEEAIFVDDSAANVETARNLGLTGVLFDDPVRARRELIHLTGVE